MPEFSPQDVITLAKIIADRPVTLQDNPNGADAVVCEYCYNPVMHRYDCDVNKVIKEFKHDRECPVLIAQDILTGDED